MHYIYEGEIIMILFAFVLGEGEQLHSSIEIDENLIIRIGNGDMEAFDVLYMISERKIYAYVISLNKYHEITFEIIHYK